MLALALAEGRTPALPGAATVSEAMALAELGFHVLKFFPAEASGGTTWLRNVAPVLPGLSFCPTGGLNAGNFTAYLAEANVITTGGAWVTPAKAIADRDFGVIRSLAQTAAA